MGVELSVPHDGVLLVELNRPDRRNALTRSMVRAMREALSDAGSDVVILTSRTPGMFCSGVDLTVSDTERQALSDELYALYGALVAAGPVIAAVDGPAVGGGAQLAVAADLRIAGADAQFRFVGVGHGLAVGPWALGEIVGRGRAFEICASMRAVGAEEASAIGLVTSIDGDPRAAALRWATELAALDRGAVTRVKQILDTPGSRGERLAVERSLNAESWDGRPPVMVRPPRAGR